MELIRVETRALLPRPHEEAHDRQFRLTKFIWAATYKCNRHSYRHYM